MREGYCIEVELREGRWIADWESYLEEAPEMPRHCGSVAGDSPSEALRNAAHAIHDMREPYHE